MGAAPRLDDPGPSPSPKSSSGGSAARVGLYPAREHDARARLFAALEQVYPVRFEGREQGDWEGLDGLLTIGADAAFATPPGVPCLHAAGEEQAQSHPRVLAFADDPALARPLRGARLADSWTGPLDPDTIGHEDPVLAAAGDAPIWTASRDRAARHVVAAAPAELAPDEALRERLVPGRCLALLALTSFLRALVQDRCPPEPPLSAAFVLDDPNLHWPSYGHLHYRELARHAVAHGYHLVVAMVPLDGWLAHPRAVRIFRENPDRLSICVHGNDHLGPELGRVACDGDGIALGAQALRRAAAFQRRTGIPVDRVMVPPHEQLSEPAARGLLACGYEAVCVSRPYPWIPAPQERGQFVGPPQRGALVSWTSREIVAGGLALLLRAGFNAPREDLVLRAFLGQPLILYGHHDVLAHGLDVLAQAAAQIDALGDVRWSSLAGIARAGAVVDGETVGGGTVGGEMAADALSSQASTDAIASPRPRLRPLLRRLVSEGRDRAQAIGGFESH
jgi:hypothetical protein